MSELHERQADAAKPRILANGGFLMRTPLWLQQALFEDDNIYSVMIEDRGIGPSVHLYVGNWRADYWPALTLERAESYARHLVAPTPKAPS